MTRLYAWWRRNPAIGDVLIVLVLLGINPPDWLYGPRGWVVQVLLTLPLLWRRRAPFAVFMVISAVALAQWSLDLRLSGDLALLVAFYTVAAYDTRRRLAISAAVLALGITMASWRWNSDSPWFAAVFLAAVAAAAGLGGLSVGTRRSYLAQVEERAARLEIERDQQARIGAAAERARIARDMHDIVAHHLSVMIALADGAAYTADRNPQEAAEAMSTVSATGRAALTDMRRLLGVLRDHDDAATLRPQPGLDDVEALIEQVRTAGISVVFTQKGDWDLPPGIGLAVYRTVQESLTNVLKHAGPEATATVLITTTATSVTVRVTDSGLGDRAAQPVVAGHGLMGIAERTQAYDGETTSGPMPAGGWAVTSHFRREPEESK